MVDLLSKFSWFSPNASKHSCSGHYRRSPKPMTPEDGAMVAEALRAAKANPVRRDVASAKRRRAAFKGGRPPREPNRDVLRVPEEAGPLLPIAGEKAEPEPDVQAITTVVDDQRLTAGEAKEHTLQGRTRSGIDSPTAQIAAVGHLQGEPTAHD